MSRDSSPALPHDVPTRATVLGYIEDFARLDEAHSDAKGLLVNAVERLFAALAAAAPQPSEGEGRKEDAGASLRSAGKSVAVSSVGDLLDMLRGYSPTAPLLCQVVGESENGGAWMMLLRAAHGDECGFKWAQSPLILTMSHPDIKQLPNPQGEAKASPDRPPAARSGEVTDEDINVYVAAYWPAFDDDENVPERGRAAVRAGLAAVLERRAAIPILPPPSDDPVPAVRDALLRLTSPDLLRAIEQVADRRCIHCGGPHHNNGQRCQCSNDE